MGIIRVNSLVGLSSLPLFIAASFSVTGLSLVLRELSYTPSVTSELAALTPSRPAVDGRTPILANWPQLFGFTESQAEQIGRDDQFGSERQLEEQRFPYDVSSLTLRGVVSDGMEGGTSVIETSDGQLVVHQGSVLPGGARIIRIATGSVEIDAEGMRYVLSFDAPALAQEDSFSVDSIVGMRTGDASELSLFGTSEQSVESEFVHENFGRIRMHDGLLFGG